MDPAFKNHPYRALMDTEIVLNQHELVYVHHGFVQ